MSDILAWVAMSAVVILGSGVLALAGLVVWYRAWEKYRNFQELRREFYAFLINRRGD